MVGVGEAVKVLVEAGRLPLNTKPHAHTMDGGAGSGERDQEKKKELTDEEKVIARKMGISFENYAKQKLAKEQ